MVNLLGTIFSSKTHFVLLRMNVGLSQSKIQCVFMVMKECVVCVLLDTHITLVGIINSLLILVFLVIIKTI